MADVVFGGDGDFIRGDDKNLDIEVVTTLDIPVDVAGMAFTCYIGTSDLNASVVLTKTCSVVGTYNADRDTNTQRVRATLTDTETAALTRSRYRISFKRTDDGSETVIARGDLIVEQANAA